MTVCILSAKFRVGAIAYVGTVRYVPSFDHIIHNGKKYYRQDTGDYQLFVAKVKVTDWEISGTWMGSQESIVEKYERYDLETLEVLIAPEDWYLNEQRISKLQEPKKFPTTNVGAQEIWAEAQTAEYAARERMKKESDD